jgi:hypothetical protein
VSERIGKYLTVQRFGIFGRKTDAWQVFSDAGAVIGWVKWWGPWRQYTFQPEPRTVFHAGCLSDLAAFLTRENEARRELRRRQLDEARQNLRAAFRKEGRGST